MHDSYTEAFIGKEILQQWCDNYVWKNNKSKT